MFSVFWDVYLQLFCLSTLGWLKHLIILLYDIRFFCLLNFVFYCILFIPCVLGMLTEADLFSCFPLISFSSFLYVLKFNKQLKCIVPAVVTSQPNCDNCKCLTILARVFLCKGWKRNKGADVSVGSPLCGGQRTTQSATPLFCFEIGLPLAGAYQVGEAGGWD